MNIRKHWKKFVLSTAAFFWASCSNNDSVAQPESESSNSESMQSSNSSESPRYYKLAADTSVICKAEDYVEEVYFSKAITSNSESNKSFSAEEIRDFLENNQIRTLEELEELEDKLENMTSCGAAPVYGVPTPRMVTMTRYICNDEYLKGTYVVKDGLLYSEEKLSSSSVEQSSSGGLSSSSSAPTPSPLCQKTDFVEKFGLEAEYDALLKNKVDSLRQANEILTEEQNKCLKRIYPYYYTYLGDCKTHEVAKKQICDGEETVNPRYLAKLDSNNAYVDKQIEECLDNETQP